MFWATVGLMVLAAGSMVLAIVAHRGRWLRASAIGAMAVGVLLGVPTLVGFSLN
jgi:hypothetical protein